MGNVGAEVWVSLASAVFAALAAAASWRAAMTGRKALEQSQMAELGIQIVVIDGERIQIHIENMGMGTARSIQYCVMEGDAVALGAPPPAGYLRGNSGVTLDTDLPPVEPFLKTPMALVRYVDGVDRFTAATADGRTKSWLVRRRWWQLFRRELGDETGGELLDEFFPGHKFEEARVVRTWLSASNEDSPRRSARD